ncbi:MAG: TIGR02449 family protein [Pseudomonadota bacterium]
MSEYTIEELYTKVDRLIQRCEQLQSDNQHLQKERARLLKKNDQARVRVEAMIGHLKQLQQTPS